ncbi:MAG: lipopolysaccharide biosynthesis protein [Lachnospiraceae bacterium]
MNEKKLSIQSSIMWNSIGSIFYLGCQWLITVIVVWISGLEDAGMLTLAMSVSNIWYSVAVYGMRNYQVSDTQNTFAADSYFLSRIVTSAIAFAGCGIYIFIIAYDPVQKICIILYFIYKLSEAFFDVYAGVYQKEWRLDYAGKSMMIRGVLTISSFVVVLKCTGSMALTFVCMAVTCILSLLCYDIPRVNRLCSMRFTSEKKKVFTLLKICFPLLVYTLLSSAIGTIPRLYLERMLGAYKLGIYGSVATPTLIIQMGATYIFNPFVTVFAERYARKEKEKFLSVFWKCMGTVGLIAVAAVIVSELLGHWGLQLLYGESVAAHVELLTPLVICTILTAFAWFLCGVLTVTRDFKGLVLGNLSAVIVAAVSSWSLIQRWDMQGASVALGLATITEIIILCAFLYKSVKKQFSL